MYIMTSEPISATYFINASHQSVCLYVYVARQRLGKKPTAATNTHEAIKELQPVSFEGKCVISSSRNFFFIF
jgi:hypothetical protein